MKIEAVALRNFMGFEEVEIPFERPIVVLLGPNESGKTTLGRDGPRWVLANDARGIKAKDVRLLVRHGAETMKGAVSVTAGDRSLVVQRTPSASVPGTLAAIQNFVGARTPEAIGYAFDSGSFLDLDPEKRKAILFALAGVTLDRALFERAGLVVAGKAGPNEDLVDLAIRRGFAPARREAETRRLAADRSLKGLTVPEPKPPKVFYRFAEDVGAETVTPAAALAWVRELEGLERGFDADLVRSASLAAADATLANLRGTAKRCAEKLPDSRRAVSVAETAVKALEEERDGAALAERIRVRKAAQDAAATEFEAAGEAKSAAAVDRAGKDSATAAALEAVRATEPAAKGPLCPHACLQHPDPKKAHDAAVMAHRQAADALARAVASAEAAEKRRIEAFGTRQRETAAYADAASERDRLDRAIESMRAKIGPAKVALREAEARKAEADKAVVDFEAVVGAGTPPDEPAVRESLRDVRAALARARGTEESVRTYHAAYAVFYAQEGERRRLLAASEDARRYEEAFAPGGIVGGLVGAPLAALRAVVQSFAGKVGLAGPVEIGDDFEVRYFGVPVQRGSTLASSSAYWRIAAALAVALGKVSGLRFAVLDEVSVCAGKVREDVLDALLALRDEFDQVVVTGAMGVEEKPKPADRGPVRLVWIDEFVAEVLEPEAATA